ncbi:MAG: Na+/H+ antiporter NhaC family protein [Eubacteriales bacterium]|nr:Na+/H+ antiporter NhaC family protein [Eubacteriales bacterium]
MYATFWSLVPPLVAILLALLTKEVYSSLFVGIVTAALFYTQFHVVNAYTVMFEDGFISSLSDSSHVGILIFLVVLGTIVVLMNKAGGSAAYGKWAEERVKTRRGTMFATFALGVLIFVDDYFNCLTVGSIMRPVTDKHKVSRAKLAYLIDATAAPVCMIAPISSWAAAVAGVVEGQDGLDLFIRAIPYNLYSLLTIAMIIVITAMDLDFGPMRKHENNAKKGDLFTCGERVGDNDAMKPVSDRGRVVDLTVPVIVLIVCCVTGMIYTGGFFSGVSFVDAFAGCDASLSLSMGSSAALLFTIVFYVVRRTLSFKDCMEAFPEGFKAMISPILILTFAWTLSSLTGLLGAPEYVSGIFEGSAGHMLGMLPAIVFLVAIFLAFSTGTSWGTFGILLPIVAGIDLPESLLVITVSACLAGAVCGDHCSPISDTTIMSSAGAQCDHINHVSTQLPYAILVAAVSFVGYCIAGTLRNPWIVLAVSFLILLGALLLIRTVTARMGRSDKQTVR